MEYLFDTNKYAKDMSGKEVIVDKDELKYIFDEYVWNWKYSVGEFTLETIPSFIFRIKKEIIENDDIKNFLVFQAPSFYVMKHR